MTNFYKGRRGLCLKITKKRLKVVFPLSIILSIIQLVIVAPPACSQFSRPTEKSIYIGDTVPDEFYDYIHRAIDMKTKETTTIKLGEYKDRLIILDFWASWCGPCKYSMTKLDSIVTTTGRDGYIVIPVTYQDIWEIDRTLDRFSWSFTSVIADTVMSQYFPHNAIPHMVWIKDGQVIAFPKWDYATMENITKAINNETFHVFNQYVHDVDLELPLFENGNGESTRGFRDGIVKIVGHVPQYIPKNVTFHSTRDRNTLHAVNLTLTSILYGIYREEMFPLLRFGNQEAIRWNISRSKSPLYTSKSPSVIADRVEDSLYTDWLMKYTFGFAVEGGADMSENQAKKMIQQSLNTFLEQEFGVTVAVSKSAPQRYAVLRPLEGTEIAKQALSAAVSEERGIYRDGDQYRYVGYSFSNQFLSNLNMLIENSENIDLTIYGVLDESGIDEMFTGNFFFEKSLFHNASLSEINAFLKRYRLTLVIKEEPLDNITVSDITDGQQLTDNL